MDGDASRVEPVSNPTPPPAPGDRGQVTCPPSRRACLTRRAARRRTAARVAVHMAAAHPVPCQFLPAFPEVYIQRHLRFPKRRSPASP